MSSQSMMIEDDFTGQQNIEHIASEVVILLNRQIGPKDVIKLLQTSFSKSKKPHNSSESKLRLFEAGCRLKRFLTAKRMVVCCFYSRNCSHGLCLKMISILAIDSLRRKSVALPRQG